MQIVRTMFCEQCFAMHRPSRDDKFVLLSKTGLIVHHIFWDISCKLWGFTPHLISETNKSEKLICLVTYCMIDGCGINLKQKKDGEYTIYLSKPTSYSLEEADWNALQKFHDPDYSLL